MGLLFDPNVAVEAAVERSLPSGLVRLTGAGGVRATESAIAALRRMKYVAYPRTAHWLRPMSALNTPVSHAMGMVRGQG